MQQCRTGEDWSKQPKSGQTWEPLDVLSSIVLPNLAITAGDWDSIRCLDAVMYWSNTLSLGKQQRPVFGRIMCNRPRLVELDESTSALDVCKSSFFFSQHQVIMMFTQPCLHLYNISGQKRKCILWYTIPTLISHHHFNLSLRDEEGHINEIPPNTYMIDEARIHLYLRLEKIFLSGHFWTKRRTISLEYKIE